MNTKIKLNIIAAVCCICLLSSYSSVGQTATTKLTTAPKIAYTFSNEKILPATNAKDQDESGTCWSFATTSFLESEILRQGKEECDLSEMFPVYYSYMDKALKKIRRHGSSEAGEGGQAHDVINIISKYGMIPESVYSGLPAGDTLPNHIQLASNLDKELKSIIDGKKISENWLDGYKKFLDEHLGVPPQKFEYKGKTYTPKEFAQSLINPDDYIEFTSYQCYPFYKKVILEIPDNWSNGLYYNLPIDELMQIIDNSLQNGYTVAWDGDISEKGFLYRNCIAIAPVDPTVDNLLSEIREELKVDDNLRQKTFDSYETTDDHLMHLIGTSADQNGNKYYVIKNSFGIHYTCKGLINMSEAYARLKVIAIMVHKNAVPKNIAEKLGIKN